MKNKQTFAATLTGWITGIFIFALVAFSIISAVGMLAGKIFRA